HEWDRDRTGRRAAPQRSHSPALTTSSRRCVLSITRVRHDCPTRTRAMGMSVRLVVATGRYGGRVEITSAGMRAFVDESSCVRTISSQEYVIGAAIVSAGDCEAPRQGPETLHLPGQIKPHWTDESDRRRRTITQTIADLGSMHVVVAHLSGRNRKTERYRRKCLETLYYELGEADVLDVTLECRSDTQDKR